MFVRQGQAAKKEPKEPNRRDSMHPADQSNRTVDDRALDIGRWPRRAAVICAAFHHIIEVLLLLWRETSVRECKGSGEDLDPNGIGERERKMLDNKNDDDDRRWHEKKKANNE
jgi:hypothetical protein